MNIHTVQDWNEYLERCGCCPMPECPTPTIQFEQKTATACGYRFPFYHVSITDADKQRFFRRIVEAARNEIDVVETGFRNFAPTVRLRKNFTTSEQVKEAEKVGGICQKLTVSRHRIGDQEIDETQDDWTYNEKYDGEYYWEPPDNVITQNGGTTYSGTDYPVPVFDENVVLWGTYDYYWLIGNSGTGWIYEPLATRFIFVDLNEPGEVSGLAYAYKAVEYEDEILPAEIDAEVDAMDWVPAGSSSSGKRFNGSFPSDNIYRKARVWFRIPVTHTGSKFWFTYDIVDFPDDGEPSVVSTDNSLEWVGFGTGDQSDPSWLTAKIDLDPPEVPGERRIVNIRYKCYTGALFGSKPQVMGEAYEIP